MNIKEILKKARVVLSSIELTVPEKEVIPFHEDVLLYVSSETNLEGNQHRNCYRSLISEKMIVSLPTTGEDDISRQCPNIIYPINSQRSAVMGDLGEFFWYQEIYESLKKEELSLADTMTEIFCHQELFLEKMLENRRKNTNQEQENSLEKSQSILMRRSQYFKEVIEERKEVQKRLIK